MKVKICGIFEEKTLIDLKEKGIWPDYIGFVFAKSRRQITTKQLNQFLPYIPNHVDTVGVFINPDIEEIKKTEVDIIQLHGDESPKQCKMIKELTGKKIWKVIPVVDDQVFLSYKDYEEVVDGFVFDTLGLQRGGSGKKFNWESQRETWEKINKKVLVAGGIHEDDLKKLKNYRIHGVDVSSGVETDGKKSLEKILLFIEEANK